MPLPASYDAWRTSPPPERDLHPGPHENPCLIEAAELCIDAMGVYDGDGNLTAVRIDNRDIDPETVLAALRLLGLCHHDLWTLPLDAGKLAELSAEAFESVAEAEADYRERMDE